jgi:hypothetical protein
MRPIPITEVFHDPEAGYFGYRDFFEGRPPQYTLAAYRTLPGTLAACDPHGERMWEEASDADENKILISRSYKPESVLDLIANAAPCLAPLRRSLRPDTFPRKRTVLRGKFGPKIGGRPWSPNRR